MHTQVGEIKRTQAIFIPSGSNMCAIGNQGR